MLNPLLNDILTGHAEMLRAPRRMGVADAAHQYLRLNRPGAESGPWNPERTPYMIDPLNRLADRTVESVVFVGPARTGKTFALLVGWLAYIVCCDPGDYLIVHMAENTARKFSKDELARSHRHSPELLARLSPFASDDNVFDKQYRNGMQLRLAWPSVKQLSGDTLRYVGITDYDRIEDSIDGEGDAFTLARKRVQTFLSSGRVVVESSPGRTINDARWQFRNAHEGPPCTGIFALYNQGDRRRWYWPCPECSEYFTAAPTIDALAESDGVIHLLCLCCGALIAPKHKRSMNLKGRWLAEGQTIDRHEIIHGEVPRTPIASYWLTGPAAAYQSWASLWQKYRAAEADCQKTGSEEALKSVTTGDFGMAYRPKHLNEVRDAYTLQARAEPVIKRTVPLGVRCLTASIDIQKRRFVVQVIGWGEQGERWVIDRFNIKWVTHDDSNERIPVAPASRQEDWLILISDVLRKPYPLSWDESCGLLPVMTAIDSAGEGGPNDNSVTDKAYGFWRVLVQRGLSNKVMLVKGRATGPRIDKAYPDSTGRSDRKANARGDIPVWLLNTNLYKDTLAADLDRQEPGPNYIHFPDWLGPWFYDELTAEAKTAKGWENLGRRPNEALDLMNYNAAAWHRLGGDRINWANPPAWADPERSAIPLDGYDAETVAAPPQTGGWKQLLNLQSTKPDHPYL